MFIHVVRAGETLWQIANRYAVTINSVASLNELQNPNQLIIGQTLVIPAPVTTHNVQPGESLWLIANRYGTTVQAIVNENQITNPNLIYPGQRLVIPKAKRTIEVNAYTYQPSAEAVRTVNEIGSLLTYVSPFAYLIAANGSLSPFNNDESIIRASLSNRVVPMMSVTNFTSTQTGSNVAHTILATPEIRNKVLDTIVQVMDTKGYRGINIDFENVLPADRELYNEFLQLTVNRLHPRGYFVSTALAPKTGPAQTGLLYEAHDYPAHGRIADFVVLMTYEWGYRFGPPRAISPINEMRKVVEYALSVMPANKIFLGFQIYARDWRIPHVQGQEAETFSPQEALRRAIKHGASIQYDQTAQSPFFRYVDEQGQRHEVWFEDARSAQAKFNLIKDYNLGGVSYWALGYPYPENWALLRDNFAIRKLV
jgi:spore germination protein